MTQLKPYKFHRLLKSVLWGGERMAYFKGLESDVPRVGESWEISGVNGNESVVKGGDDDGLTLSQLIDRHKGQLVGEAVYAQHGNQFPLLIKLIDAEQDLSLQVHPNDELAKQRHNCYGKTEMWYLIDHKPGAKILSGMSQEITPEEYEQRVADGTILDVVAQHESHMGDVFFLPSGRIHGMEQAISSPRCSKPATSPIEYMTMTAAMPTATPASCMWSRRATPSTTPCMTATCCPILATPLARPRS